MSLKWEQTNKARLNKGGNNDAESQVESTKGDHDYESMRSFGNSFKDYFSSTSDSDSEESDAEESDYDLVCPDMQPDVVCEK